VVRANLATWIASFSLDQTGEIGREKLPAGGIGEGAETPGSGIARGEGRDGGCAKNAHSPARNAGEGQAGSGMSGGPHGPLINGGLLAWIVSCVYRVARLTLLPEPAPIRGRRGSS